MDLPPDKQATERHFTRFAPIYSQVGLGIFPYFSRCLVDFARIPPGARVLDVACGRGASLFPAVEQVGLTGDVTGIDLSSGMAFETQREITARAIPNARALQMDAEKLLFPSAHFDVLLCAFALFYFPNLHQALSEFRRVLKPGGQLTVATWTPMRDPRWSWLMPLAQSYLPPEDDDAPSWPAPDFTTPTGMQTILSTAGFINLCVKTEPQEFFYRDESDWWCTGWSAGQYDDMERFSGPAGLDRFKTQAFAHLQSIKTSAGLPQRIEAIFAAGNAPTSC